MGSPDDEPGHNPDEALHEVVLTRPFFIQTHELTQETWAALVPVNPSEHKGPKLPVNRASWFDAVMYANLRSERDGLTPYYAIEGARGRVGADLRADAVTIPDTDGPGWRLPTEAEWEYACRAGSDTLETPRYGPLREIAWYGANARRAPQPVGQLQPNAWGLYDMLGNVWEWVWDRHAPHMTKKARDPLGPAKGAFRVYRGSCFSSDAAVCRAANRGNALPDRRLPSVGFRLARNLV
jgi:formylglycine-generating enzyme required for sulfatase activity